VGWKAVVGAIALSSLVSVSAAEAARPATLALSVGPRAPRFNSELWLVGSGVGPMIWLVRPNGTGRRRVVYEAAWLRHGATHRGIG
jgi:hypothetical protein